MIIAERGQPRLKSLGLFFDQKKTGCRGIGAVVSYRRCGPATALWITRLRLGRVGRGLFGDHHRATGAWKKESVAALKGLRANREGVERWRLNQADR